MAESKRHPQAYKPKGTTVIKFVMKDDPSQELDVIKEELTAHGLKLLKKYGYVQATKLLQDQAKKSAAKEPEVEDPEEDEEDDDSEEEPDPEPQQAPQKAPGRARPRS